MIPRKIASIVLSLLVSGSEQNIATVITRYGDLVKQHADTHSSRNLMVLIGVQVFIATHDSIDVGK